MAESLQETVKGWAESLGFDASDLDDPGELSWAFMVTPGADHGLPILVTQFDADVRQVYICHTVAGAGDFVLPEEEVDVSNFILNLQTLIASHLVEFEIDEANMEVSVWTRLLGGDLTEARFYERFVLIRNLVISIRGEFIRLQRGIHE